MKITFLGTGTSQGVPVIACECEVCRSIDFRDKRLRSSVMIESEGYVFVIDAGPDFREQMLRANVKHLDALLLTHAHKDHIAGLDDVRAFNYIQKKAIDVYAREDVQAAIKNEFSYAFAIYKYPGVPEINLHTVKNKSFEINNIKIIPIEVTHFGLKIFGYRIGDFTYITDANFISDEELNKIKGSKVVVLNALRKKKHVSHFSLSEAVNILEIIKPESAFVTHISHMMGFHADVEKELPSFIKFAYDGLIIEL
ncbi:MAG: MBL fold metallo-hydrolase [Bacteroidales bacterium]